MIARIWKGVTLASDSDRYVDYMKSTGIKDLRAADGNESVLLLRRSRGKCTEFVLISLWDSAAAIEAFTEGNPENAVYYPEDESYLLELQPNVEHYEVLIGP